MALACNHAFPGRLSPGARHQDGQDSTVFVGCMSSGLQEAPEDAIACVGSQDVDSPRIRL